jgi:hypothetical protein
MLRPYFRFNRALLKDYCLYGVNIQTRCCADGYWVKLR